MDFNDTTTQHLQALSIINQGCPDPGPRITGGLLPNFSQTIGKMDYCQNTETK